MTNPDEYDDEVTIEAHPIYHHWYRSGDIVTERSGRNVPIVIEMHRKCQYCPTERIDTINVHTWRPARKPRYKYRKYDQFGRRITIIRMNKSDYLKQEFLKDSDLDAKTLDRLRKS